MKKVLLSVLVVITALLVVTGCGKKVDPIVGTWKYQGGNYEFVFKEDGSGSYAGRDFTYEIKDNEISILYKGDSAPFKSTFKIEKDTLIMKDSFGEDVKYDKKK